MACQLLTVPDIKNANGFRQVGMLAEGQCPVLGTIGEDTGPSRPTFPVAALRRTRRTGAALPSDVLTDPPASGGTRTRPFGGIDVAVAIDRHAFAGDALQHADIVSVWWDERGDTVLTGWPDTHAGQPTRMPVRVRLRIDRVERVVIRDE